MKYADIVIEASGFRQEEQPRADSHWWRHFDVRVLTSPAGEMPPEAAIHREYDDTVLQSQLTALGNRKLEGDALIEFGRKLASLLLPENQRPNEDGVRALVLRTRDLVGQDGAVRLRLRLPQPLAPLPWEYTYVDRPETASGAVGFIALDSAISIVRHDAMTKRVPVTRVDGDITVLAALASPTGPDRIRPERERLQLDDEERQLKENLEKQQGIKARIIRDAKLTDLESEILHANVLHFAGHGTFESKPGDSPRMPGGKGAILLDDGPLDAETLAVNLQHGLRLVVLASCESGKSASVDVWGGIASALARAGVPAVVANQYKIRNKNAVAFTRVFYSALVAGLPIDFAVSKGRLAAYNEDSGGRDWGVPVLYLRSEDGELFSGAADRAVRADARRSVGQVIVNGSATIRSSIFGDVSFGTADVPRSTLPANHTDRVGQPQIAREPALHEPAATADRYEVRATPAELAAPTFKLNLASAAVRPVVQKLVAEWDPDDSREALACVFDLVYEVACGDAANTTRLRSVVSRFQAIAAATQPELRDLFRRTEFKTLIPQTAMTGAEGSPMLHPGD